MSAIIWHLSFVTNLKTRLFTLDKHKGTSGWRDDVTVKHTGCCSRRTGLQFPVPMQQLTATGNSSYGACGTLFCICVWHHHSAVTSYSHVAQTYMQATRYYTYN